MRRGTTVPQKKELEARIKRWFLNFFFFLLLLMLYLCEKSWNAFKVLQSWDLELIHVVVLSIFNLLIHWNLSNMINLFSVNLETTRIYMYKRNSVKKLHWIKWLIESVAFTIIYPSRQFCVLACLIFLIMGSDPPQAMCTRYKIMR